jgi:hypothetical protein
MLKRRVVLKKQNRNAAIFIGYTLKNSFHSKIRQEFSSALQLYNHAILSILPLAGELV